MDKTNNKQKPSDWAVGSAYDFLGLSPEEAAYVDLKLRLSKALRTSRKRQPLSQSALAKKLRSSQSRVAKMERGDPSVTIDLLLRSLILLGLTRSEIANILVFEEPKALVLESVTVASTGESKQVYWSQYRYCPGKSAEQVKTYSSGNDALPVNNLVREGEVAYG